MIWIIIGMVLLLAVIFMVRACMGMASYSHLLDEVFKELLKDKEEE